MKGTQNTNSTNTAFYRKCQRSQPW